MNKVSVIVPIYNCEDNLNKCLDSIRKQTYDNLQIILVDNGSSDNSKEIAKGYARFDSRVKLFNVKNLESYELIHHATDNSTGKYILYVDSQNSWLDKDAIKIMVENQEKYSSDVIQVDSYNVQDDRLYYDDRYNEEDGEGLILDNKYLMEEFKENQRVKNNIWGKLYKAELIKESLLRKQTQIQEGKFLYKVMSMADRGIILHKPMIYNIK